MTSAGWRAFDTSPFNRALLPLGLTDPGSPASMRQKLQGPAVTMVALGVFEALAALGVPIVPAPVAGLLLTLYAAIVGGILSGLLSAAVVSAYYIYFIAEPSAAGGDLRPLFVISMLAPAVALLPIRYRLLLNRVAAAPDSKTEESVRQARFLAEASALLDTSLGFSRTVDKLVQLMVPELGDWCAVYLAEDAGRFHRETVKHPDPIAESILRQALARAPLNLNQKHPLADVETVLRTGEPLILEPADYMHLGKFATNNQERVALEDMSPKQVLIVPLPARGRIFGAVVLVSCVRDGRYGRAELELATEFCRRAGLAADNARLYDIALDARREAERASERAVNTLESISDGFIALDEEWRFTYANGEAERMLGRARQQLLNRVVWTQFPRSKDSRLKEAFLQAADGRQPVRLETELDWVETDEPVWLEVHAFPSHSGLSVYFRDITSRKQVEEALKRSEEQLRHSQKMEAVGRLAGGVAHDFNNILMSIAGYTELLMARMGPDDPGRGDLREIQRAADRASALTRQLLAFSRKQVHEPRLLDLNQVINQIENMLQRLIGENVVLVTKLAPDLGKVYADPGQLEQVIMNLAVNARDAMPGGGMLMISTENTEIEQEEEDAFTESLEPRPYVKLSVSDTGTGMDDGVIPHIFEPFYTTKEKGKGTGLGLSTVYGIIKQSGGNISVSSRPTQGARFDIVLPRLDDADLAAAPEAGADGEPVVAREELPRGTGVVLLAEDETPVRKFVATVLRQQGYTVLEAENGVEGVAAAGRYKGEIDLLLSDVMMPGMGGRELATRIRATRADTRVMFMSGYAEDEIAHQGILDAGARMLEKPFSAEALIRRVAEAMGEGEDGAAGAVAAAAAAAGPASDGEALAPPRKSSRRKRPRKA